MRKLTFIFSVTTCQDICIRHRWEGEMLHHIKPEPLGDQSITTGEKYAVWLHARTYIFTWFRRYPAWWHARTHVHSHDSDSTLCDDMQEHKIMYIPGDCSEVPPFGLRNLFLTFYFKNNRWMMTRKGGKHWKPIEPWFNHLLQIKWNDEPCLLPNTRYTGTTNFKEEIRKLTEGQLSLLLLASLSLVMLLTAGYIDIGLHTRLLEFPNNGTLVLHWSSIYPRYVSI